MLQALMMPIAGSFPCSSAVPSTKDSFSPTHRISVPECEQWPPVTFYIDLVTSSVIGKFQVIRHNVKLILLEIGMLLLVQ